MPEIQFVQFKRPRGQELDVSIERPQEVYVKAMAIFAATFRLECEELSTGDCVFYIADGTTNYASVTVPNGPGVPDAVDKLIFEFDISKALETRDHAVAELKEKRRALRIMAQEQAAAVAAAAKR